MTDFYAISTNTLHQLSLLVGAVSDIIQFFPAITCFSPLRAIRSLRNSQPFPSIRARTNKFHKSFLPYCLKNFT